MLIAILLAVLVGSTQSQVGETIPDTASQENWSCPHNDKFNSFSLRIEHGRVFWTSPLHPSYAGPEGDVVFDNLEWRVISNTKRRLVIVDPYAGSQMISLDRQTGRVKISKTLNSSEQDEIAEETCTKN